MAADIAEVSPLEDHMAKKKPLQDAMAKGDVASVPAGIEAPAPSSPPPQAQGMGAQLEVGGIAAVPQPAPVPGFGITAGIATTKTPVARQGIESPAVGSNYPIAGADFKNAGEDFAQAGIDRPLAGAGFAIAGADFGQAGAGAPRAGADFSQAGASFPSAGRDFQQAGKGFDIAGSDFNQAGAGWAKAGEKRGTTAPVGANAQEFPLTAQMNATPTGERFPIDRAASVTPSGYPAPQGITAPAAPVRIGDDASFYNSGRGGTQAQFLADNAGITAPAPSSPPPPAGEGIAALPTMPVQPKAATVNTGKLLSNAPHGIEDDGGIMARAQGSPLASGVPVAQGIEAVGSGFAKVGGITVGLSDIGTAKDPLAKGFTGSGVVKDQADNSAALIDDIISRQPVGIDKDALMKTIRTNALSGIMPDPQQVRDAGLTSADVVGILSGANRNGQFTKGIETIQGQQTADAVTAKVKNEGITAETGRINAEINAVNARRAKGVELTAHTVKDTGSPTGWSYLGSDGKVIAQSAPDPSKKGGHDSDGLPDLGDIGIPDASGMRPGALKGVSQADQEMIKKVANYSIELPKGKALTDPYWKGIIGRAVLYDNSFSADQYNIRQALKKDFTSGKSAGNIRSLNTAVGHLDTLEKAGKKLGNIGWQTWNKVGNAVSVEQGDSKVTKFNTAVTAVESELASVFKGTGATDQEIKAWRENINSSQSPEQLQKNIHMAIELMGSRLGALNSQYETGLGKPKDFKFLNSKSEAILKRLGVSPDMLDPSTQVETVTNAAGGNRPPLSSFNR